MQAVLLRLTIFQLRSPCSGTGGDVAGVSEASGLSHLQEPRPLAGARRAHTRQALLTRVRPCSHVSRRAHTCHAVLTRVTPCSRGGLRSPESSVVFLWNLHVFPLNI